jgi:hypothetical protein
MQDRPQSGWERHGVTPGKAFQVFGMRRSGNHAIIDWLMRNAPGETGLFFNNCKMGADPINNFSSLDTYPEPEEEPQTRRGRERWQPPDLSPSLIVVSYEDNLPPAPGKSDWASRGYRLGDFDTKIMIYRSFLNWSASMLRKIQRNDGFGALARMRIMGRAMDLYAEGLDRIGIEGLTSICYDHWMLSEDYRAGMLSALGLPCTDNSLGKVQRFGGGSSFERQEAAPEEMQTTARAAQMAQDLEYRAMLWTAAQDDALMAGLETHFPEDARRLTALFAGAELNITLEAAP